ncbi:MAG: outer membrane beta-barrel protein [Treponema sp.]|jgi:hypothetical protein|nr:outer membrane beta-barrel protein [Treponema sp.]
MRKAGAIFLLLLMGLPILLAAQEDGAEPEVEPDWDEFWTDLYVRGDQTFNISLATVFPAVFLNNGQIIEHKIHPPVGGTGGLSYNYFFNSNVFLGGELSGNFLPTISENFLYIITFGLRGGYQFNIRRFEFPVFAAIGMSWQTYLDLGYYGLYMRGGAGGYFRATSDWSFGLVSSWIWLPQWTDEASKNVDGNVLDLTISARYHF